MESRRSQHRRWRLRKLLVERSAGEPQCARHAGPVRRGSIADHLYRAYGKERVLPDQCKGPAGSGERLARVSRSGRRCGIGPAGDKGSVAMPPSGAPSKAIEARRRIDFSKELAAKGWYHSFELPDGSFIDGFM